MIEEVEVEAKRIMGPDPAHGWPHVERVRRLARKIVEGEGLTVDWQVLDLAIILHDVGRSLPGEGHHAVKSALYAKSILRLHAAGEELIEAVVHAIEAHSYSLGVEARSLEAKVLSDADKLDALGAVGIARVFHHGCQHGRSFDDSVEHIRAKLLRLPGLLHLPYSRKLARSRMEIILDFLDHYAREAGGRDPGLTP